jgi:hypothetical protein
MENPNHNRIAASYAAKPAPEDQGNPSHLTSRER